MDRRYICPDCATKWFIPAARPELPALTSCAACGGQLVDFIAGRATRTDPGDPSDPQPRFD